MVDFLAIPVDHDKTWSSIGANYNSLFGNHRHGAVLYATVMHQNAQHLATRLPGPDIDRQTIADSIERAFLQQHVR